MTQHVTQTPHAGQDHPDSGHDHHNPHLAHHFDTMEQQYDTGKLGMWTFLATELLMFGGLFCAYAVYRANNPEVFLYSASHLNTMWGAINTAVLLASSLTMAWAVRASQLGQQKLLVGLCLATLLGGGGFMMIKAVEYNHKFHEGYGPGFMNRYNVVYKGPEEGRNNPDGVKKLNEELKAAAGAPAPHAGIAKNANEAYQFRDPNAGSGDAAKILPVFSSTGGLTAEQTIATEYHKATDAGHKNDTEVHGPENAAHSPGAHDAEAGTPHGHMAFTDLSTALDRQRVNTFFGIYYCMTGLHGVHVLVGMALIVWITYRAATSKQKAFILPLIPLGIGAYFVFLYAIDFVLPTPTGSLHVKYTLLYTGLGALAFGGLWLALRVGAAAKAVLVPGEFSENYFAPVDLVGLYWHLVDLIWIFLFPLLYLIHGKAGS